MYWWIELDHPAFEMGEGDFPRTGQVVKYYRQAKRDETGKMKYSQEALAKELNIGAKTMWNIENRDAKIDFEKRKLLCNLLDIPPMLLGLTSLTEIDIAIADARRRKKRSSSSGGGRSGTLDIAEHQQTLDSAYQYHKHSSALWMVDALLLRTDILYRELPHSKQKAELNTLLGGYHRLLSSILREDMQYSMALDHIHRAIFFANELNNDDDRASALIIRGRIQQEMGDDIIAIETFQEAASYEKRVAPYINGVRMLYEAPSFARRAKSAVEQKAAVARIDRGGNMARMQEEKNRFDFTMQRYHLEKGLVLTEIGWYEDARNELGLVRCACGSWWNAYQLLYLSQAYLGQGNYPLVASHAQAALSIVQGFHSQEHIAQIANIHHQLVASSFGRSTEVRELGRLLRS